MWCCSIGRTEGFGGVVLLAFLGGVGPCGGVRP